MGAHAFVYDVRVPKRPVSVRIDPDVYARIEALAKGRRWSVSQWIAVAAEKVADAEEAQQRPKRRR